MTTLPELIARLEAATGPDRELDGELALSAGWTFQKMARDRVAYWRRPGETEYYMRGTLPPYTASLDSALALVEAKLPGWWWEVSHGVLSASGHGPFWASLYFGNRGLWDEDGEPTTIPGPTPPLALLLALCRALQAQAEGEGR